MVQQDRNRFEKAIALNADNAEVYRRQGDTLFRLKRPGDAIESYDKAISQRPDYAEAYNNRGSALKALGKLQEAIASYDKAISLNPNYALAHTNRGTALKALGQLEVAIASYDSALALDPHNAATHSNRGNALQILGRLDEAIASYDKTIALKPDYAGVYNNRGVAFKELKKLDQAIASFDEALALNPNNAEARWNRATAYLMAGRFDPGWRDFQARMKKREPVGTRQYAKPLWFGDVDIAGKTIFVYWEQGFGDTIQFCRYIPLLERTGAKVLFQPQKPLKSLMRSLRKKADLIDDAGPPRHFDFHCPLMSLPLAFKTEITTIPRANAYLDVADAKVRLWDQKLGKKSRPRIGVAWSGGLINGNDINRSIDLEQFRVVFDDRFEIISLQKEVRDRDKSWLKNENIRHFGNALDDFSDTAALCCLVDLVVSVDTSVAHLAGALGKPIWTLIPWVPDWRWMLDREDSPWYPSMRLFRQQRRGDWNGILHRLKQELKLLL